MGLTPCLLLDLGFSTGVLCETAFLASGTLGLTCMSSMGLQTSLCRALFIGQLRSAAPPKPGNSTYMLYGPDSELPHHCKQQLEISIINH